MSQITIQDMRRYIAEKLPPEVGFTRIEFEGPAIAIFVKNPEILLDQGYIIADIVSTIKKRIVVRPDIEVRKDEEAVEREILSLVPKEAGIMNITFDPSVGEVIIEARKPGLVIGKNGTLLKEIVKRTKWKPRILRSPARPSKTLRSFYSVLYHEARERERILRVIGERAFRPPLFSVGEVTVTCLGGFREVGRSAILVRTKESSVLLDCGLNPGALGSPSAFPRLDNPQLDLSTLDAVVITHAHLDHCALVPYLFKYGYDGPVYCTPPTAHLMTLLQNDFLKVLGEQGRIPPYEKRHVRDAILHTITLGYGVVTDITPDIKLTFYNAGHILGSAIVHLHIGRGFHNVIYTGDFKFGKTMLLEPAAREFPRVETLIMECTYGGEQVPPRPDAEAAFVSVVNETLEKGGKVLIPVPAVGRAQEMMLVIDKYMREGKLIEAPVYIDGMISEATAIHITFSDFLASRVRASIQHGDTNPFEAEFFTTVDHPSERQAIIEGGPCIILASSGMLEGGPSVEYLKGLAEDPRNTLIFVSYQIEGTLGGRIVRGLREFETRMENGKVRIVRINMRVEAIEGFTGHSDDRQLRAFLYNIQPKPRLILLGHGEKSRCLKMEEFINSSLRKKLGKPKMRALAPSVLETIRLA
ncbi:MAG TPA: beta-CASP ribonuclease aCPSF1 [Candidatus Bathyarchaeota archaeon]|nr:beta-CASP ribonuclease aCPSF1 [Candidatus Bathyarchaeota archaeon]